MSVTILLRIIDHIQLVSRNEVNNTTIVKLDDYILGQKTTCFGRWWPSSGLSFDTLKITYIIV